jgi:hypothetical protein
MKGHRDAVYEEEGPEKASRGTFDADLLEYVIRAQMRTTVDEAHSPDLADERSRSRKGWVLRICRQESKSLCSARPACPRRRERWTELT